MMRLTRGLALARRDLVAIDVDTDRRLVLEIEAIEHEAFDDRGFADPDLAQKHDLSGPSFDDFALEPDLEFDAPVRARLADHCG